MKRDELEQTIATLEAQRTVLGDAVVETTIAALQEKLKALDDEDTADLTPQRPSQRKQVTILFAHISGLARISSQPLPDTGALDIMNILWQRLDQAIAEQGGTIDKLIGDEVMGLFGVPLAHEDDPQRAIRAALAMRAAFTDFIHEMGEIDEHHDAGAQDNEYNDPLQDLQLRIGINTGPVLLSEVGTGDEYSVIGDAVNVASRLCHSVPSGGILISHHTYKLVGDSFIVEPLGPLSVKGKSEPLRVYLVLGARPHRFHAISRAVEGIETHMVGRDEEMQQLQATLNRIMETGVGQMVTIMGEAGVGKSRLLHEFNSWIKSLPQNLQVFKGRTDRRWSQLPYSLIRDLFTSYFNVQDSDRALVAEEKLFQGMRQVVPQTDSEVRSRVRAIGQLIGFDLSEGPPLPGLPADGEAPQLRERAFTHLAEFFEAVTAGASAALLYLEDVHWADRGSLDLIIHLAQICRRAPLFIICLARPSLLERRPSWGQDADVGDEAEADSTHRLQKMMELDNLSDHESHQLVVDILRKVPQIPADLLDLIVSSAEGNPFYVEELIKVLIEDGVILTGERQWQVQPKRLTRVRVPATLRGVLQARLDRLSSLERIVLQRAAVIGRAFWDSAIVYMNTSSETPMSAKDTRAALQALEKREMIFRRKSSVFAGTQEYIFKHTMLREVAYESVLLRQRPIYHNLAAEWLAEQSGERVAEYAGLIARHYELAGEETSAAELFELAAGRAQEAYDPEVAINYYGKALSLLAEKLHYSMWHLRLQEQLGELLRMQARLVEAAQTYMAMQYVAEVDGDLAAQARALNGQASIYRDQARYQKMLESAAQAEQVAWLVSADIELIHAFLYKGEAQAKLGDGQAALAAANEALSLSYRIESPHEITLSLSLLCSLYLELGRLDKVRYYLAQMDEQIALLADDTTLQKEVAFNKMSLGDLYKELGYYDKAVYYLLDALKLFQELDYQLAVGNTLNTLGETARLRGNPQAAIPLCRQALSVADSIGYRYGELLYRTNLGGAHVSLHNYRAAEIELRQVIGLSEDAFKVVNWFGRTETYCFLALACLGQGRLQEALSVARHAHALAMEMQQDRLVAMTWRVLGQVLAQQMGPALPALVDGKTYKPRDCFAESLRILKGDDGKSLAHYRQQLQTLWTWSSYELAQGEHERAQELREEAQKMADFLKVEPVPSPDAA